MNALENAINHVRIGAEIEKFGNAEQAVVARLLIGDESTVVHVLAELKEIRALAGSDAFALCAHITDAETYLQASRLVKSTLLKRLSENSGKRLSSIRPVLSPGAEVAAKLGPLLRRKKAALVIDA